MGSLLSDREPPPALHPEGFAHGFCVVSETALVSYKCTQPYTPRAERTLLWSDPRIAIPWPLEKPLVSANDAAGKPLRELADQGLLPRY